MNRVEARRYFEKNLSVEFDKRSCEFLWKELISSRDWKVLDKIDEDILDGVIRRLLDQEPIQYILGRAYFYDFELNVSSDTLIPRSETEELVDWMIQDIGENTCGIIDIGTGSGCIPLALKKHLINAVVEGIDISERALEIAKVNAKELGLDVHFYALDVLNSGRFENTYDVIVSNPPYIPNSEKELMSSNVLDHEPHLALFVENDQALIFYSKIASIANQSLSKNGYLYFECNEYNAKEVVRLLEQSAWKNIILRKDMQGKDRMIRATKPD